MILQRLHVTPNSLRSLLCAAALVIVTHESFAGVPIPDVGLRATYSDKLTRKVKITSDSSGDHVLQSVKASTRMRLQLPLNTVDLNAITSETHVTVNLGFPTSGGDVTITLPATLNEDPKYQTGGSKATIVRTETFEGKTLRYWLESIKINSKTQTMDISFKLQYLAAINGSAGDAGIGTGGLFHQGDATGTYLRPLQIEVRVENDESILPVVVGSTNGEFVAAINVVSTPVEGPGGTYSNVKITTKAPVAP
jgi:hypothetical protein